MLDDIESIAFAQGVLVGVIAMLTVAAIAKWLWV